MLSRGMLALFVAVSLGVVGCTGPTGKPSSAAHTATSATKRPAATPQTSATSPISCGLLSDFPNPTGPAYAGPGPHLAVVDEELSATSDPLYNIPFSTYSLPIKWMAYDNKKNEEDISRAQLVICLTDLQQRSKTKIGQCEYDTLIADVYPATYTFEVYEARTGRRITTFKIRGNDTADLSCPVTLQHQVGSGVDIAQGVKDETLSGRLRPLIMGPAR